MRRVKKNCILAGLAVLLLTGCGQTAPDGQTITEEKNQELMEKETIPEEEPQEGELQETAGESAADGHVDFDKLKQSNPDIFAWLYVPGTDIDIPVLQSSVSDEYYKTHNAEGEEGVEGAVYTEMPNLMNMCDFNTILHGKDIEAEDLFTGLHKFEDIDFFEQNEVFYLYLPDNVLTYEIIAAYYDEGSDILRRYDYTTYDGCQNYLNNLYGYRSISKNMREGWDDLTPYHFLVTLDGSIREDDTQYVVIGALISDAAGTIDRVILDEGESVY
ncbi:MAG: class B sortase [Lachnospiraceae bacterium]|nr:class B sortase [Lachnospiraceae bacterium]